MNETLTSNGQKTKDKWVTWVQEKLGEHPYKNFKYGKIEWCHAFYRGEQYKIWDERKGIVREVNIPRETRSVQNMCRPFVDTFTAKMLKDNPTPSAVPLSTNTEAFDENLSLAFSAMAEYWWKKIALAPRKLRKSVKWAAIGGIGIDMIYYNRKMKSGIYTGDVDWISINPRHFFLNPDATPDRNTHRWGVYAVPREKSVVEEEFGLAKDSLTSDDKEKTEGVRTDSTKSQDTMHSEEESSTVIVYDIWYKECAEYPRKWYAEKNEDGTSAINEDGTEKGEYRGGRHVIVAGGRTLVDEDYWGSDELPFLLYNVKALLDDPIGQGLIYPILTIQRDRNRLNSLIMENASLMALIKWLDPEQSNTLPSAFTNEAGEIIKYNAPYKPEQTQAKPMPQYVVGRPEELFREAQFETGIQDVGLGMIPYRGSQTSPGVIRELGTSESINLSQEVEELTEHIQDIMRMYRKLSKKYYIEERIVNVLGENKRMEAKTYLAKDDNNDYDWDIKVGGGFDKSDEAIMSQITALSAGNPSFFEKAGVDFQTLGEFVMRKIGLTKLREDTYKDKKQAERNLAMVVNGIRPIISKYINPDAHIKVFTDFTKTEPWEILDDGIKFAIDWYIDQCNAIKMGMMLPQMQMAMAANQPPQPPMQPQPQTPAEKKEAEQNRRLGTGQPVQANNMGQGGEQLPPQGA
jgi:hypothetical protein